MTVRRRDKLEPADVEISLFGCVSNALRRADQDRIDEPELVGFDRAAKRDVVARVRDSHFDSRRLLGRGDQSLVLVGASRLVSLWLVGHLRLPPSGLRQLHAKRRLDPTTLLFSSLTKG